MRQLEQASVFEKGPGGPGSIKPITLHPAPELHIEPSGDGNPVGAPREANEQLEVLADGAAVRAVGDDDQPDSVARARCNPLKHERAP
jgi:hypothetical protein